MCESCENSKNEYYRKLDDNPRPICSNCYNKMSYLEKRHYWRIDGGEQPEFGIYNKK